ncbi:hypothetical protein FCOIX_3982 [Fusarium coicis]|nr:hypothetical protein FCOIX_3982 [Fusarium coicis]
MLFLGNGPSDMNSVAHAVFMLSSKTKSSAASSTVARARVFAALVVPQRPALFRRVAREVHRIGLSRSHDCNEKRRPQHRCAVGRLSIEMGKQLSAYQQNDSHERRTKSPAGEQIEVTDETAVFPPAPHCCRPNRSHGRQHERRYNTLSSASLRGHPTGSVCCRYGRHWVAPSRFATWLHAINRLLPLPPILLADLQAVLQAQSPKICVYSAETRGPTHPRCRPADLLRITAQFAPGYADQLNSHEAKKTSERDEPHFISFALELIACVLLIHLVLVSSWMSPREVACFKPGAMLL